MCVRKKNCHVSSTWYKSLGSVNYFKLCTKLITATFFKKLWQHYSPRWIFCPSPKDEIRIRLQLHCPLSRFCIVDVSPCSSPFNGAQRYILTLFFPMQGFNFFFNNTLLQYQHHISKNLETYFALIILKCEVETV